MTRKEKIEEAAQEMFERYETTCELDFFVAGTKWADEHPDIQTNASNPVVFSGEDFKKWEKRIQNLEQMLAIAQEAMSKIINENGHIPLCEGTSLNFCDGECDLIHYLTETLAKIAELKK